MTSFHGLSGIKAIVTIGAALSMTAGLALAADNSISSDQIVHALQPKPVTRGLSAVHNAHAGTAFRRVSTRTTVLTRAVRDTGSTGFQHLKVTGFVEF